MDFGSKRIASRRPCFRVVLYVHGDEDVLEMTTCNTRVHDVAVEFPCGWKGTSMTGAVPKIFVVFYGIICEGRSY